MADDRLRDFDAVIGREASVVSRERFPWATILLIFAASRVVTTSIMLWFAERQPANAWTTASPSYIDFAQIWDGNWYFIVAAAGYPSELPVNAEGHVTENAWAFMPVYPFLVRGLMGITGASFGVVAVSVSVIFALATALMFFKLMSLVLDRTQALFAVALLCFAPLSPIMQVAYAESMHMFLLTLALYLLLTRRYVALLAVIPVMALTRPSGLAFALALGLHVVYRWVVRERDPFPGREIAASVTAVVVSLVSGFAWLLIAWAVTGKLTAYTDTELAWRSAYVGYGELIPFEPWLQGAAFWMSQPAGPVIVTVAALTLAGIGALLFAPAGRRLGVDLRLWVASYVLYLLAVFFPQSSTFRLLVPIFPLLGALAQPRSRLYQGALIFASVAGQIVWIHIAYWVDGYDWTPP